MFKRVMVAVVGVPFLILVLGWAPAWATMVLLAGMCAIGAWELMHAVAGEAGKPLIPLTVVAAALVPVCVYLEMSVETAELTALPVLPLTGILGAVFVFLVFLLAIHRYDGNQGIPFAAVTAAIFGALVFPLMLSCLLRLRMVPSIGMLLVFFPLCISFGSDTCALFAGMLFGKHKLAPRVSPKKTVEGAVGGLVGGMLGMVIFRIIFYLCTLQPLHIGGCILMGLVGALMGQLGDLSFSVIKRQYGIKDYGRLLPGHGGVLDRFDSVLFAAPVLWLMTCWVIGL